MAEASSFGSSAIEPQQAVRGSRLAEKGTVIEVGQDGGLDCWLH